MVVRQARGEASILAFLADGEGELEVRNDGRRGAVVHGVDDDAGDAGRRQRVGDEARRIVGVVDDVDLLPAQLGHDGAHARTHRANACALGVDALAGGGHGDLRAMSGFAGDGLDLNEALLNLGDLTLEEAGDEVGVGARQGDTRATLGALNAHDIGADAVTVAVGLTGNLLTVGQDGFKVVGDLDHRGTSGTRSLDGARDDLAFASGKVTEHALVIGITQALHDDGARGRLCDATEVLRGIVEFADGIAVFVLVHGHDGDASGLLVDFDAGLGDGTGQVVVRLEQRLFDGIDEGLEADTLFVFHHPQSGHIDFHGLLLPRSRVDARTRLPHVLVTHGNRSGAVGGRCDCLAHVMFISDAHRTADASAMLGNGRGVCERACERPLGTFLRQESVRPSSRQIINRAALFEPPALFHPFRVGSHEILLNLTPTSGGSEPGVAYCPQRGT